MQAAPFAHGLDAHSFVVDVEVDVLVDVDVEVLVDVILEVDVDVEVDVLVGQSSTSGARHHTCVGGAPFLARLQIQEA